MPHPLLPDLETLATKVAASKGFALCGIQLLTHMSTMTLEVQIRHSSGEDVSLDDCAGFSGVLGDAIEALMDTITQSPGRLGAVTSPR